MPSKAQSATRFDQSFDSFVCTLGLPQTAIMNMFYAPIPVQITSDLPNDNAWQDMGIIRNQPAEGMLSVQL